MQLKAIKCLWIEWLHSLIHRIGVSDADPWDSERSERLWSNEPDEDRAGGSEGSGLFDIRESVTAQPSHGHHSQHQVNFALQSIADRYIDIFLHTLKCLNCQSMWCKWDVEWIPVVRNSGYFDLHLMFLTERSFQKAFLQLLCLWQLYAWKTQLTGWSLTSWGCYLRMELSRSLWLWTEQTNRSLLPAPALWRKSSQSYLMTEGSRSVKFLSLLNLIKINIGFTQYPC